MPITLTSRTEPQTLRFGDASIRYLEAPSDSVLSEIRRGVRKGLENPDCLDAAGVEAAIRLASQYVVGWEGVVDAHGVAVPWPADGSTCPGKEDQAIRVGLLRALPFNVLAVLDAAIAKAWRESAESGKGSPSGSGG